MTSRNLRLAGKSGIITAGASGIGRAGVLRFAAEGARIAVVDVNAAGAEAVAQEVVAADGEAFVIAGDLTDAEFARHIVQKTISRFGALDYIWNHAGHPGPKSFEDMDLDEFDLCMNLNVRAPALVAAAAIPYMRDHGGGSLVFTASAAGLVGSGFTPLYSAAKFGVVGLVKSLAKRYGKVKIRSNAVCPGTIDTPMLREYQQRPEIKPVIERNGPNNPLGRNGEPDEIANAALFLASDEASFVNGAVLSVDGGLVA